MLVRHLDAPHVAESGLETVVQLALDAVAEHVGQQPILGDVNDDVQVVRLVQFALSLRRRRQDERGDEQKCAEKSAKML